MLAAKRMWSITEGLDRPRFGQQILAVVLMFYLSELGL